MACKLMEQEMTREGKKSKENVATKYTRRRELLAKPHPSHFGKRKEKEVAGEQLLRCRQLTRQSLETVIMKEENKKNLVIGKMNEKTRKGEGKGKGERRKKRQMIKRGKKWKVALSRSNLWRIMFTWTGKSGRSFGLFEAHLTVALDRIEDVTVMFVTRETTTATTFSMLVVATTETKTAASFEPFLLLLLFIWTFTSNQENCYANELNPSLLATFSISSALFPRLFNSSSPSSPSSCGANLVVATKFGRQVVANNKVSGLAALELPEYIQIRKWFSSHLNVPLNGQERVDVSWCWRLRLRLRRVYRKWSQNEQLILVTSSNSPRMQSLSSPQHTRGQLSPLPKSFLPEMGRLDTGHLFGDATQATSSGTTCRIISMTQLRSMKRKQRRIGKEMERNPSSENCGIRFIRNTWLSCAATAVAKTRRKRKRRRKRKSKLSAIVSSKVLAGFEATSSELNLLNANYDLESSSQQRQKWSSDSFCCQDTRRGGGGTNFAVVPLSNLASCSYHLELSDLIGSIFKDIKQQCCCRRGHCCCGSLAVDVKVDSGNEAEISIITTTELPPESTLMPSTMAATAASSPQFRKNVVGRENVFTETKFVVYYLKIGAVVTPVQVKYITLVPSNSFNSSEFNTVEATNNEQTLHRLDTEFQITIHKPLGASQSKLVKSRVSELLLQPAKAAAKLRQAKRMRGIRVARIVRPTMMAVAAATTRNTTALVTVMAIVATTKVTTRSTSTADCCNWKDFNVITAWFGVKLATISSLSNAIDLGQTSARGGGDAIITKSRACCRQEQQFHWLVNSNDTVLASITSLIGRNQAIQFAAGFRCCKLKFCCCCPSLKLDLEKVDYTSGSVGKLALALIHQTFRLWLERLHFNCRLDRSLRKRICPKEGELKEKKGDSAPACESECRLVILWCYFEASSSPELENYSLSTISPAATPGEDLKVDQHRGFSLALATSYQADQSIKRAPHEWPTTMRSTFNATTGFENTTKTSTETTLQPIIFAVQNAAQSMPSRAGYHLTSSPREGMQAVAIFCFVILAAKLVMKDLKWLLEFELDLDVHKKMRQQQRQLQLDHRLAKSESKSKSECNNHQDEPPRSKAEVKVTVVESKRTYNRISMIDYTAKPMGECDKRRVQHKVTSNNSNNNNNDLTPSTTESLTNFWPVIAISQQQTLPSSIKWPPKSSEHKMTKGRAKSTRSQQEQVGVSPARGLLLASFFLYCVVVIDTTIVASSSPVFPFKANLEQSMTNSNFAKTNATKINPQFSSKLEFWRLLLQPVLSDISSERTANLDGVDGLALKLASWPDQKRATLLYLDLLAERRDRILGLSASYANNIELSSFLTADSSSPSPSSDPICRRASLAELEASIEEITRLKEGLDNPEGKSNPKQSTATATRKNNINKLKQFISLNELNKYTNKAIVEKLNKHSKFSDLAKLAVENSNLISRLLIHSKENEIIKRIVSKDNFFKYLLSSKVRQVSSNYLHSLGLIFLDYNQGIDGDGNGLEGGEDGRGQRDPEDTEDASIGKSMLRLVRNSMIKFSPLAVSSNGQDSVASPLLFDLATHPVASDTDSPNGYFKLLSNGTGQSQPFVAKWVVANELEELQLIEKRLEALLTPEPSRDKVDDSKENPASTHSINLNLEDGRWFSPYFDCGVSNTWLFTYSIPFFASSSIQKSKLSGKEEKNYNEDNETTEGEDKRRAVKLRGVSFVNLNLGPMRLIDQCASVEQSGFFLANTHQCSRLELSHCVRLEQVEEVRSGAYVCQCPAGGSVSPEERLATERWRDQLAEQVNSASLLNSKSTFERLALELDEQLGDKLYVANQLRLQHQLQQQRQKYYPQHRLNSNSRRTDWQQTSKQYFALGSQLDSDAAIHWFTGGLHGASWPHQICRLCKRFHHDYSRTSNISNQSSSQVGNDDNDKQADTFCSSEFQQPKTSWIGPFVLVLQSICVLITLALIATLLRVRKSRIIIVSGWLMLETTLVGALILYSSVFVRYFEPTSITCLLEPWLRELGFSIFYGSILIKLYRILTEFQTRKAHRVCFRDKDQIVYLLAIVLIVVCYMSAWTALMVDDFFFSRQKATPVSSSLGDSQAEGLPEMSSSLAFRAVSSSPSQFEAALKRSSIAFGEEMNHLKQEKSVRGLDGETNNSRYRRYLNSAFSQGAEIGIVSNNLDRFGGIGNEFVKKGGKTVTASLINKSLNQLHQTGLVASNSGIGHDDFKEDMVMKKREMSDFHYIESDFLLVPSTTTSNSLISFSPKPHFGIPNKNSSALLNNSLKGSRNEEGLFFDPTQDRTTTTTRSLNEISDSHKQQQPLPTKSDLNYNSLQSNHQNLLNQDEGNSRISSAFRNVGQFSSWAPSLGEIFTQNLNSFSDLFSSLLESEKQYDEFNDLLTYSIRCRKLTWDYVTELSEMGLLLFGIYLVYKLRNASSEVYKEKLILSASLFIELFISAIAYSIRHLFWDRLTSDQILILYCLRCQLTVTLTVALVFGPKLWTIGKSKPTLFSNSRSMNAQGGSMRHRCHISCEIHDHHLNDAMRLHQAMLSNAALDIGSINLADMDPDEIQAELKRVYAQLEVLKTKAMRRDNPHISKRRGGRAKTGHRKFSLQAFHAKHLGGHHAHSSSSNSNNQHQNPNSRFDSNGTQMEIHDAAGNDKSFAVDHKKLPVVVENELRHGEDEMESVKNKHNYGAEEEQRMALAISLASVKSNTKLAAAGGLGGMVGSHQRQPGCEQRRVRVDDRPTEGSLTGNNIINSSIVTNSANNLQHHRHHHQQHHVRHQFVSGSGSGSGSGSHHHRCHHHHHHHHQHKNYHTNDKSCKNSSSAAPTQAEPTSTSSACVYFDDDTLILNDSQSSGNVSPQRQSSFICSQSSIHREDSSLN